MVVKLPPTTTLEPSGEAASRWMVPPAGAGLKPVKAPVVRLMPAPLSRATPPIEVKLPAA